MSYPAIVLPELHFIGVADPGVANLERIVIRPTQPMTLNGYGIVLGAPDENGQARTLFDNCFWFPDLPVAPPSWILVYTGRGETRVSDEGGEQVLNLHWQRVYTIFGNRDVVPVLFRLDSAVIGPLL